MTTTKIEIEPAIISWVIEKIQEEEQSNSTIDTLNRWLSGEKIPTFNQVEDISKKLNIPFGYFFLKNPPKEKCEMIEYRTIKSSHIKEPSRNLIDTIDKMTEIQEWMRNYLMESAGDTLPFVAKYKDSFAEKNTMILDIRNTLSINKRWYNDTKNCIESFKYLRQKLETIGVIVMLSGIVEQNTRRKLDVREFRAFTLIDRYAPLIFINACDTDAGKLFSLLHEFVHIWLGENSFYNDQYESAENVSLIEKTCNAVTSELLVPNQDFIEIWDKWDIEINKKIEQIAKYFKCSQHVIARKALNCAYLTKQEYNDIIQELLNQFELWEKNKKDKQGSGGNFYNTMKTRLDSNFMNALSGSVKEGKTQYTDAYRLTNTNRKTFSKLVNEDGGSLW